MNQQKPALCSLDKETYKNRSQYFKLELWEAYLKKEEPYTTDSFTAATEMLSLGLRPSSESSSGVAENPGSDDARLATGTERRPVKAPAPRWSNFACLKDGRAVVILLALVHAKEAAADLVHSLPVQHCPARGVTSVRWYCIIAI